MKSFIFSMLLMFTTTIFAQGVKQLEDIIKAPEKQVEQNCVKKDKNGKCPAPPKTQKPTPKKVEKKAEPLKK